MDEIWLPVPGLSERLLVSTFGRVRSLPGYKRQGKILKPSRSKRGYLMVSHGTDESLMKHKTVHRLVALAFIPNPLSKRCVNHINGIKSDNRVENLEWATHSENSKHAISTGLNQPPQTRLGVAHPFAKLNPDKVREIRRKHRPWEYGTPRLATEYGVTTNAVKSILAGKTWKHVV